MNNQKRRAARPLAAGIYKPDSIIDVADSLGITNLPETVASALASDVEYRLHQLIEEASRFTRHSRRTTMTTSDVDQAMKALNIEPVYGHSSHRTMSFKRVQPSTGPSIYVLEDEEIDFEKVLTEETVPVPRGIRYTAHWLAIEGVQPLIPENPPATIDHDLAQAATSSLATPPSTQNGAVQSQAVTAKKVPMQPESVKTHLSRELQHYYTRLVTALSAGSDDRKKTAALTSLRADAGLQQVLPYLVRWVGEGVVGALRRDANEGDEMDVDRRGLQVFLQVIGALLENERLFVEPYLHQLLPPILSILLTATLFVPSLLNPTPSEPTPSQLRTHASSLLAQLLNQHSPTYPSLAPRVTKTLLAALIEPGRMLGTREGAIRGLIGVGKEAVRRGFVQAKCGEIVREESDRAREMGMDVSGADQAIMDALDLLHSRVSASPTPFLGLNDMDDEDRATMDTLVSVFGESLARTISENASWAKGIVGALGS